MTDAYTTIIKQLETIRDTQGNPFWNIDNKTASLLQTRIRENNYTRVLELGTSNGLSALYLGAALIETGGTLVTVESHAERFALAATHIQAAHMNTIITQVKGHAPEVLDEIDGIFDLLFIDATSVEYELYYEHLKSRIAIGGCITADNIGSHQEKIQPFLDHISTDPLFDVHIEETEKGLLIAKRVT